MANKNDKALHDRYYKALVALGEKVTKRQHLSTYRKKWKKLEQTYKQRGEKRPTLAQAQKLYNDYNLETDNITLEDAMAGYLDEHRDENMQTPPADIDLDEMKAMDTIDLFTSIIDKIYSDTLAYIEDNKAGKGHEGGKLASIADDHQGYINDSYLRVKEKLAQLMEEYPIKILAQAIQDNVELDYAIAVGLEPPSSLVVYFDITLEQLNGISAQIEARATELREQAEREYYGE